ncbi:MAG: hypothetical protein ACE5NG_20960, partial [bacterium]
RLMANDEIGYHEDPKNANGIVRARTTKQIRSWHIPRSIKALERLNEEMGEIAFPGNYILFDGMKAYIGEAGDIYDRLKVHIKNPEEKIKNWDNALIRNDGRPATQSDFNDTVIRLALELHLIRLLKANRYRVVCQGRQPTLNPIQKQIVNSLLQELNHFLLKKNIITKVLEEKGLEEVFEDELKKLLAGHGKQIQNWTAKEAIIDGQKAYIRPGSLKQKGWQITFRDRFLNSLQKGEGYVLVNRDGVLLVPLSHVRKVVKDKTAYQQNTIDIYVVFTIEKITMIYKKDVIDVTTYRLRK